GLHEIGPGALANTQLHVVQLAYKITRRSAGETGNRTEPFQVGTVAYRALCGFAATCCDQRLALLDTPRRHVRYEARMRITQGFSSLGVLRRFNDPLPDRLLACFGSVEHQEHATGDASLRDGIGFNDPNPWRPLHRSKIRSCGLDFLIGHGLCE